MKFLIRYSQFNEEYKPMYTGNKIDNKNINVPETTEEFIHYRTNNNGIGTICNDSIVTVCNGHGKISDIFTNITVDENNELIGDCSNCGKKSVLIEDHIKENLSNQ